MSFWVGGSGNWSDAAAHWAAVSGGAPGAGNLPTSLTDAVFDANSNPTAYTVTLDITASCRNLNFAAAPSVSGTITFAMGANTVNISGGLTALSGMLHTTASTVATFSFVATSGSHLITSNGKVWGGAGPTFSIVPSGAAIELADVLNLANNTLLHQQGTFTTNSFNLFIGNFVGSSTGVRTLNLGASTVACTGWSITTATNLTFNAGTSTINSAGSSSGFLGGGLVYNNASLTPTSLSNTLSGANTFNNLTLSCSTTRSVVINVAANQTVTGTFTATGNSILNRVMVQSDVAGTTRTITAAVSNANSNADFMDIAGAGAAAPFTGTSMGDCLGNSGITFDAPVTQIATGTASFTWSTHGWTTRVPLPQDDVVINNAFIAGRIVTMDMPRAGRNIDCSGAQNSPAFQGPTIDVSVFGSWTSNPSMTINGTGGGLTMTFRGRSACTFLPPTAAMNMQSVVVMPGGSLTLAAALSMGRLGVQTGTFDTGGFSVTCSAIWDFAGALPVTINLQNSLVTLTGNDTSIARVWGISGTNTTLNAGTSTIKLTDTSAVTKTFLGGSKTYYNLWLAGSGGVFGISAGSTFNDFRADTPGSVVRFVAGTTQTAATWTVSGAAPGGSDEKFSQHFGTAGGSGYWTSPDQPAVTFPTEIDMRAKVMLSDVLSEYVILSQSGGAGFVGPYLRTTAAAGLKWSWSADGTNSLEAFSAAAALVVGVASWVRVTHLFNNGAGQNEVKFWTSPDGVVWTQHGATITNAGTTSLFDTTFQYQVGARGGATAPFVGRIFRAELCNSIGGAANVVYEADDYAGAGAATLTTAGTVWTKNGNVIVSATNLVAICTATAANHTLAKSGGGIVECQYVSIDRSTATPGSTFYAWNSSIDGGNNSGWTFGAMPIEAAAGAFSLTGYAATDSQPKNIIIQVRDDLIVRLKAGLPSLSDRVYQFGEVQVEDLPERVLPAIYVEVADDTAEDMGVNGGSSDDVPNVLEDLDVSFNVYCIVKQGGDAEMAAYALRSEVESALFGTVAARTLDGKVVWIRRQAGSNNRNDLLDSNAYAASLRLLTKIRHLDKNPDSFTY